MKTVDISKLSKKERDASRKEVQVRERERDLLQQPHLYCGSFIHTNIHRCMRTHTHTYMCACVYATRSFSSRFPWTVKQILGALKHPNIIEYREAFEDHSQLCIVMAYAEGGDLSGKIKVCIGCP